MDKQMIAFIFDTETSGLTDTRRIPLDKQPEIIELYAAVTDLASGDKLAEVERMIKPRKAISDEITRITGITNDDLKDALPFSAHASDIEDALARCDAVIAHNLSFDMEMVDIEFERLGQKVAWPARRICTVEQTMHLKGHRLGLMALHELLFKEPFPKAHRARNDVDALIRCVKELLHRGEL